MKKLLLVASAMWLGCSGDSGSSVSVGNSNPVGIVGGIIWDAATEMPLPGATVKIISGGKAQTATTDMDGLFSVTNVPAGLFIATVSQMGYLTATVNSTLSGAVGNFPVSNPITTIGPIGLVKNDGTFAVKIVDQFGSPQANISVTARPQVVWINFGNAQPGIIGAYEVTATSGADGVVSFMGLPDYTSIGSLVSDNLPIDVPPALVSGSMTTYSFLGGTFSFQVNHLVNSGGTIDTPIIKLAGPTTALSVLDSNVDLLRGMTASQTGAPSLPAGTTPPNPYSTVSVIPYISTTGTITIEFNQVINKGTIRVAMWNEDGTVATTMMMAAANSNVLTLMPSAALTAGARYNLTLHVDAQTVAGQGGIARELNTTVPLFVAPATGAAIKIFTTPPDAPHSLDPTGPSPQPVVFRFTTPVGIGFGNSAGVSCLAFYDLTGTAGLDNDPTALYPGEYDRSKLTSLTCPTPGLDITSIVPLEPSQFPITGFSSKWQVTYNIVGGSNPECKPGTATSCSPPATGTQLYLEPSRASTGSGVPLTFKTPDGAPVPNNDMNLSFPIPPP
jgi:hypothetical protein